MPHTHIYRRKPATVVVALVALLLASLGLAACGSSSSSSTKTTTSASTGAGAKGAGRFAAVRECLEKEGITLPTRTPGQKRPPGGAGGFLGGGGAAGGAGAAGGPKLPAGVTRAKYEAALKKCGGGQFGRGGAAARFNNPTFKAALAKFATCMRENGVNVPAPNTSGSGPVFDTKGIDTSSAQFKAAEAKCQSDLSGAFKRGTGAGAPGTDGAPAGAAPPRSGEAPGGAAGPPPAG
jgi:hypothetical protein